MNHLTSGRSPVPLWNYRRAGRISKLLCFILLLLALSAWPQTTPVQADVPTFDNRRAFGPPNDRAQDVAMGDMNDDGYLDIVVGQGTGEKSTVYLNDGTGDFHNGPITCGVTPFVSCFGDASDETVSVKVGDMDNDGDLDIIAANSSLGGDPQSRVYLNDGAAVFHEGPATCGVTPDVRCFGADNVNTASVAVGDVDNNGSLDIATGVTGGQNAVFLNDGDGNFFFGTVNCAAANVRCFGTGNDDTASVALGRMDANTSLDIITGNVFEQSAVYLNQGGIFPSGPFTCGVTANVRCFGGVVDDISQVATADVNADGRLDIAVSNRAFASENAIYLNLGGATFNNASVNCALPPADVRCFPVGDGSTLSTALGDMDNDGDIDVMWGNDKQHDIFLNNGTGVFSETQKFGENTREAVGMTVGDVDNDSDLEIIIANSEAQNEIFINNGAGVFASASNTSTLPNAGSLALVATGDIDGDSDLDIVTASVGSDNLIVFNNGTGSFPTGAAACGDPLVECYGTGSDNTRTLALGDMDGDGDLDIVVGNSSDDSSIANSGEQNAVYLNDGNGNFAYGAGITCATAGVRCFGTGNDATRKVALADLDGDGDLDIATANYLFDSAPAGRFRRGEQNAVYFNDGSGNFANGPLVCETTANVACFGTGTDKTWGLSIGDMDNDGDSDLIVGNEVEQNQIYLNDGNGSFDDGHPFGNGANDTRAVPVGDVDGDGDLDIVTGNYREQNVIYLNNGVDSFTRTTVKCGSTAGARCFGTGLDINEDLVLEDMDGDSDLDIVAANMRDDSAVYLNDGAGEFPFFRRTFGSITDDISSVAVGDLDQDGDMDLVGQEFVYLQEYRHPLGDGMPAVLLVRPVATDNADFFSTPIILDSQIIDISYTLADPEGDAVRSIRAFYSPDGGGNWLPAAAAAGTETTNLSAAPGGTVHTFRWDTFASGFFGQSDNVVFRIEAYPSLGPDRNRAAGPFQRAYSAATTFPFRVRGTQVQVLDDDGQPVADALVYRLPQDQEVDGELFTSDSGQPFTTDNQGYLQGRGELASGDRLFAMVPVIVEDTFTLYHTSGTPTEQGIDTFTVGAAGVQQLTVSADHPLILFDVLVSLEWDASNDPGYLEQLAFNLGRASQYLYDFTNGQVALGKITVAQNADDWAYAHIVIQAANNVRPYAIQGGIVTTTTIDPDHSDIVYEPGQVTMGSTWNRYGNPGTNLGDDWPIILAHELSHYLFYLDDVYLGFDENGFLRSVDTCTGSAMGDVYTDPRNTEFIADDPFWQANCAETLTNQTLGRDEWQTMALWYPWLKEPAATLGGPGQMPFNLTSIEIDDPITPTSVLIDPTFYLAYTDEGPASNQAQAYLMRDDYIVALGSPYGGQNRVKAHGAQPGDRLCAFDQTRLHYGCEIIALGDERLDLEEDSTWTPIVQITPQSLTSLTLDVTSLPAGLTIKARLYPEYGGGLPEITLSESGGAYAGTFTLEDATLSGYIQVWVDETDTEANPRRETLVAYSIGGNPGKKRAGNADVRGGGGKKRAGNADLRGGGGKKRAGNAPVVSADGQMIFFTDNPILFEEGDFYTIQTMSGLPALPPGRSVIGQGYNLVASPGAPVFAGSISFQYLGSDVLASGVDEEDLTIYFWDGSAWHILPTVRDPYYNLASARSEGAGIYALMASTEIALRAPGWNLIAYPVRGQPQAVVDALLSIDSFYTRVYGYDSTDTGDPWKLYAVDAPEWVNDLALLEFGQGYWINATQAVTLYLESRNNANLATLDALPPALQQEGLPDPPTPYYGQVLAGESFTPAAGMPVQARINGAVCGATTTRLINGQVVYSIDVLAADSGTYAPCGAKGDQIVFEVDGVRMEPSARWDNTAGGSLDLSPATGGNAGRNVYLPVIVR